MFSEWLRKWLFYVTASFVLCPPLVCNVVPQRCDQGEYSIFGKMLRGHTFKRLEVSNPVECLQACNADFRCYSFNYVIIQDVCELNNRTREAAPEDFVPNFHRYYFKRNTETVLLGSIYEFPAKSCKEIKATDEVRALSNKYWFDSIVPGKTIQLYCDMEKADADECNASIPLCDVINGICQNTIGSYLCSCKVGFTGDGKNCTDFDECNVSPSVCDAHATCQNNIGSHVCTCKVGYTGDGKTCTDVNECSASPCDANANCQNNVGSYVCSCKPGYTGDGKTCSDINECSASPCNAKATCQNNAGSYVCSCNPGYTGDGKISCNDINECSASPCDANANCQNNAGSYVCSCNPGFTGDGKTCQQSTSCQSLRASYSSDGTYQLQMSPASFSVYCDMRSGGEGWTLIARFSNSDAKNWMKDTGAWWYDKTVASGGTTSPSANTDMISPAFWRVSGTKIKITRSDDALHTPLLLTTGDCLGGHTFRSKITSYGNFRNGAVWASNLCRKNCAVQYGGSYTSTQGFAQAACSGDIQAANKIGFWCDWSTGDGAVMMIGGGGGSCSRADHGIGVTEANQAAFADRGTVEADFGNSPSSPTTSYSLNLWIR